MKLIGVWIFMAYYRRSDSYISSRKIRMTKHILRLFIIRKLRCYYTTNYSRHENNCWKNQAATKSSIANVRQSAFGLLFFVRIFFHVEFSMSAAPGQGAILSRQTWVCRVAKCLVRRLGRTGGRSCGSRTCHPLMIRRYASFCSSISQSRILSNFNKLNTTQSSWLSSVFIRKQSPNSINIYDKHMNNIYQGNINIFVNHMLLNDTLTNHHKQTMSCCKHFVNDIASKSK